MKRFPLGTVIVLCAAGLMIMYSQFLGSREIEPEMVFRSDGRVVYDAGLGHEAYAWSIEDGLPNNILNPLHDDSLRMADIRPDDSLCVEFGPNRVTKTYVVFAIHPFLVTDIEADYYIVTIAEDRSYVSHRATEIGLIPMQDGYWSVHRTSQGPCPI